MFSQDLPSSVFGIELFKINPFTDDEVSKGKKRNVNGTYYTPYGFKDNKIPKQNTNFSYYGFWTGKNDAIMHIIGQGGLEKPDYTKSMEKYTCSIKKENLISSLKKLYSIDKFQNVKLQSTSDLDGELYLTDRDFIKITNNGAQNYNRVFAVECMYYFDRSNLRIRLDSREYYTKHLVGMDVVTYLDFDLLADDLTGF